MNHIGPVPITAGQSELPVRPSRGLELFECFDERQMIFSRVFEARDVKEERFLQLITRGGFAFGLRSRAWKKALVIEAIVNDGDTGTIHLEKTNDILGGIFANGDDLILAMCQAADNDAAIEHPFPVVFPGDVEGR